MLYIRQVTGDSMLPTLKPGRFVVAVRPLATLKLGDIVIVHHQGRDKLKRITRIAVDKIYIEGDNKAHSTDSRHFGWIDTSSVLGKVILPRLRHATKSSLK